MADVLTGVTETVAGALDVISSRSQEYLQQEAKMLPVVSNYSDLVVAGSKQVEIPRAGGFTVASKSENTAADASSITWSTDTISLDQHKYVQWLIEDIANVQTVIRIVEENVMRASKDMARDVDQYLVNILETASASAPDHRIAYDNTTTIAEADILEARQLLIQQYLNPKELFLAINPAQESAMLQIANFIQADRYGSSEPIMDGEIGKVFGVRVLVHNDVESLKSLMFHPSAVGFAQQLGPRFQSESDLANLGTRYSLDMLYGASLLDSGKRCVMIGTAA